MINAGPLVGSRPRNHDPPFGLRSNPRLSGITLQPSRIAPDDLCSDACASRLWRLDTRTHYRRSSAGIENGMLPVGGRAGGRSLLANRLLRRNRPSFSPNVGTQGISL